MILTKDEILAAIAERGKTVATVNVPAWGGDVCIRRMTAADIDHCGLAEGRRDATVFARVIATSLTDEDGTILFGEEDALAMASIDMGTAATVFGECMRVNGLLDADLQAAIDSFTDAQIESSSSS